MCGENSPEYASNEGETDADECVEAEYLRVFCWMTDYWINGCLSQDSSQWGLHSHNLSNKPSVFSPSGSEGGPCPPAHYCPEGSPGPVPCPAGTYTNLTGQSACSRCPAGYFCAERTHNFTQFPCPPGFYCPDGRARQYIHFSTYLSKNFYAPLHDSILSRNVACCTRIIIVSYA